MPLVFCRQIAQLVERLAVTEGGEFGPRRRQGTFIVALSAPPPTLFSAEKLPFTYTQWIRMVRKIYIVRLTGRHYITDYVLKRG